MMSSIELASSSGLRSISAFSGIAARSSARSDFSEPLPARPMGVRMASTITASGMLAGSLVGFAYVHRGRTRAEILWETRGPGAPQRASEIEAADAELVEADVVGELVAHRAHDLLAQHVGVVAEVAPQRVAEHDDGVVGIVARGAIALVHAVGAGAP